MENPAQRCNFSRGRERSMSCWKGQPASPGTSDSSLRSDIRIRAENPIPAPCAFCCTKKQPGDSWLLPFRWDFAYPARGW